MMNLALAFNIVLFNDLYMISDFSKVTKFITKSILPLKNPLKNKSGQFLAEIRLE